MAKGGHAWQRGACVAKGVHGEGGWHVWQRGVCVAKGGACVVKGGMHGKSGGVVCTPHEIRPVIARAVRILLECILV